MCGMILIVLAAGELWRCGGKRAEQCSRLPTAGHFPSLPDDADDDDEDYDDADDDDEDNDDDDDDNKDGE